MQPASANLVLSLSFFSIYGLLMPLSTGQMERDRKPWGQRQWWRHYTGSLYYVLLAFCADHATTKAWCLCLFEEKVVGEIYSQ